MQSEQNECFRRHYERCMLKVGDRVRFKKPKRTPTYGYVDCIETNLNKMFWSAEGHPRYIRVVIEDVDDTTGEIKTVQVWTAENKIMFSPKGTQ